MFVRIKKSGNHKYLHIVKSERRFRGIKQKMIASLGRLDDYEEGMALYELAQSLLGIYADIRDRKRKSGLKRKKH